MNATKWTILTEFVQHSAELASAKVKETPKVAVRVEIDVVVVTVAIEGERVRERERESKKEIFWFLI
jgi:hypothetical protein